MATGRLSSPGRKNKEKNSTVSSSPYPKGLPSVHISTNATSVTTVGLNKLLFFRKTVRKGGCCRGMKSKLPGNDDPVPQTCHFTKTEGL